MKIANARILASASVAVIAISSLSATASAQAQNPAPVTPSEANVCADRPTQQERDLCLQGQAQNETNTEEAGELGTIPPEEAAEQQADSGAIVVTGSRLRTSPFSSPDPITVINPELEEKGGKGDAAEILQTNPVAAGSFQITSVISAGTFVTDGGYGAQTLSLRGLGPERTLVLVNGRRAGPAGTRGSIAGFDLNVLPSALIRSVEIVKTGTSSVYGSDAIAGTVNMLTKRDTEGLELRLFGTQPFSSGGESYNANAVWGKDFGRGHIILAADYYRRNELKARDRNYLDCPEELVYDQSYATRVDVLDPRTGEPRCINAVENMIQVSSAGAAGGVPGATNLISGVIQYNNPGDQFDQYLIPIFQTGTPGNLTGPAGFYFANYGISAAPAFGPPRTITMAQQSVGLLNGYSDLQRNTTVLPQVERYTFWADGAFELTDNIEIVGEALYNKRKTDTSIFRQIFFNQFTGNTTAVTAARCPVGTLNNCVVGDTGDPLNSEFSGNVILLPVVGIPSTYATEVDYWRGVLGARGDFGGTGLLSRLRWDTWVQYSRSDGDYTQSRVFTDAIEKQVFRSRSCAGQLTRIRGVPCLDIDFTDPRILRGEFNAQESEFLFGQETGNTIYTQLTGEASIAGELFSLPAGDVGVALGGQWRRDKIDDTPGPISLSVNKDYNSAIDPTNTALCNVPRQPCQQLISNVYGQSVSGRTAGKQTLTELFGEVLIPLIHNTPFIERLEVSGAARLTNVSAERFDGVGDKSNNNWTYKLGANWQVNDWLRFRGSIGTSYRSPALYEQFLAPTTAFPNQTTAIDPCINWTNRLAQNIISQTVADRCAALGIPGNYAGLGSSALQFTGGGIGVLDPETSVAKALSIVLTPRAAPIEGMRMSFAIDYFDFKVKDEITQLGAGNIIYGCFESETYPNDPLCSQFDRQPSTSDQFPQIAEIRDSYINIATQRNRGVDVTARINQDMGSWGELGILGQVTWQIEDKVKVFADSEYDSAEGELGEPQFVGDFKVTWDKGPWSLFYGLNVVGGVSEEEDWRFANGGTLCAASATRGGFACPVYRLPAVWYHSASVSRDFGKRLAVTAGVSNIFNTKPPSVSGILTSTSPLRRDFGNTPTFGTQYDLVGRRAFLNIRAKMF